jgi:hypothetical protein
MGLLFLIKFRELEYWSNGVMVAKPATFLQHSNTPSLQYSTID